MKDIAIWITLPKAKKISVNHRRDTSTKINLRSYDPDEGSCSRIDRFRFRPNTEDIVQPRTLALQEAQENGNNVTSFLGATSNGFARWMRRQTKTLRTRPLLVKTCAIGGGRPADLLVISHSKDDSSSQESLGKIMDNVVNIPRNKMYWLLSP